MSKYLATIQEIDGAGSVQCLEFEANGVIEVTSEDAQEFGRLFGEAVERLRSQGLGCLDVTVSVEIPPNFGPCDECGDATVDREQKRHGEDFVICDDCREYREQVLEDETCDAEGCTNRLDDGEGYDGLCGEHADRAETAGAWS